MITKTIDSEVLEQLKRCQTDGPQLKMAPMPRDLYVKVTKVLELLGGKWTRKNQAHVFDRDAAECVQDAVTTGTVTDRKQLYQFFETPPVLAKRMVTLADVKPGDIVLEPNAGKGALIAALRSAHGESNKVFFCELDPDNRKVLMERPSAQLSMLNDNFMLVSASTPFVDVVLMNPPFSKGQDVLHVQHAYSMLKPGGRLVAVMAPGWTYRQTQPHKGFREFFESHPRADKCDLEAGTFAASGTNIYTVLITLIK